MKSPVNIPVYSKCDSLSEIALLPVGISHVVYDPFKFPIGVTEAVGFKLYLYRVTLSL